MPSLADLGRKIKADHPEYQDLSDQECGELAKLAYPGQYAQYTDEILVRDKNASFNSAVRDLVWSTESLFFNQPDLEVKVNQIINTFNNQGWLNGWFAEKRTKKHTELLENLSINEGHVITQYMMMATAVREGKTGEIEFKKFVALNTVDLLNIQATARRIEKANELDIPETKYTELRVGDLTHKQEFVQHQEKTIFEIDQEIRKARQMAQIEIDKQVEVAERTSDIKIREEDAKALRDWKRYYDESMLDAQLAIVANLEGIAEATALTAHLGNVIEGIDRLKRLPDGYVTQETMKTMENAKQALEQLIQERYAGLLQGTSREKQKGLEESQPDPEDE